MSTTSCPPPARRAPKIEPIAPAPTTAILMMLLSSDEASSVRVEPTATCSRAAVDKQSLAGQERSRLGAEQQARADELLRPTGPLERNAVEDPPADVGICPDRGCERRIHEPGRDRVRPDPMLGPFERH